MLKKTLKNIQFSATGNFEPSEIAKSIQSVENRDERRIIANAIIGEHAKWLMKKMWYPPSTNAGGAGLKDVAAHILRQNSGSYGGSTTPLIWQPLGALSLERFCYEAADSDVNYDIDLPF